MTALLLLSACGTPQHVSNESSYLDMTGKPDDFDERNPRQHQALKEGYYYNTSGYKLRLKTSTTSYVVKTNTVPDMSIPHENKDVEYKGITLKPVVIDLDE